MACSLGPSQCAVGEPLLSFAYIRSQLVPWSCGGWEGPCFSLGPWRQVSHYHLCCCHCHYDQGCGARMCFTKQRCCWSYSALTGKSCPFPCGNTTWFWRIGDCYWDPWCCTLPASVTGYHLARRCVFLKEKITVWGYTLWALCVQETANRRSLCCWRGTWHSCMSQSGIRVLEDKLHYP